MEAPGDGAAAAAGSAACEAPGDGAAAAAGSAACEDEGAWYAAAAAEVSEEETYDEDPEEPQQEGGSGLPEAPVPEPPPRADDPYEAPLPEPASPTHDPYEVLDETEPTVAEDPYLAAVLAEADPYQDPALAGAAAAASQPKGAAAVAQVLPSKRPAAEASTPPPPLKLPRTQSPGRPSQPAVDSLPQLGHLTMEASPSHSTLASRLVPPAPPMPEPPSTVRTGGAREAPPSGFAVGDALPPGSAPPSPPPIVITGPPEDFEVPVPDPPAFELGEDDDLDGAGASWDERVVVVRQGQVHIELQHRNPPMGDEVLLRFCDWLDKQMPLVVQNFPYVRRSGAYVDLSDNAIGPDGLDKLFRVLRDHRVPCVVMKAYRNLLNDSIVDTLIEYLYTQPESFPMHGIHISHNKISDKGAHRLIRAAALCGHYPRFTSRLPLWLRLECNDILQPEKLVADCNDEGFNVCLMGDGLCSRPNCNHYSGVHVQLPYFFHQHGKASSPAAPPPPPRQPPAVVEGAAAKDFGADGLAPDWMRRERPATPQTTFMMPAPKRVSQPPAVVPTQAPAQAAPEPVVEVGGLFTVDPGLQPPPPFGQPPPAHVPTSIWSARAARGSLAKERAYRALGSPPAIGGWAPGCGKNGKGGYGGKGPGGCGGGFGGKGAGGGGGKRGQMWQGPTLMQKAKFEVKLSEADVALGFTWTFLGEGTSPQLTFVDFSSPVAAAGAQVGHSLLRINGLDAAMFNEKQVTDMLKQRPITLRFGDA